MVYSSSAKVKFVLTVHGKEYETSSSRSVFLGQYVLDACDELKQSFFTGKSVRFQGPLGRMKLEPKDQKFSSSSSSSSSNSNDTNNTSNNNNNNDDNNKLGRCSFDIHPVSNVEYKCGIIEEITSPLLKGARKKWYAVLADRQLYLFGQYGDSRPKVTIQLGGGGGGSNGSSGGNGNGSNGNGGSHGHIHNSLHIEWYDDNCNIIKMSNLNNQTWLLTCGNLKQLKAWYNKVREKEEIEREEKFGLFE
jgi:hypothetical protein